MPNAVELNDEYAYLILPFDTKALLDEYQTPKTNLSTSQDPGTKKDLIQVYYPCQDP